MLFNEFCENFEVTKSERIQLIHYLAFFRYWTIIRALTKGDE